MHEEIETKNINEITNLNKELKKLHEEIKNYKQKEEIDKHHHNLLITNIEKYPVMNNLLMIKSVNLQMQIMQLRERESERERACVLDL